MPEIADRPTAHFVLWCDEPPYDDYWVISDTRTADRLLQTRDERHARNVYRLVQSTPGWWDSTADLPRARRA